MRTRTASSSSSSTPWWNGETVPVRTPPFYQPRERSYNPATRRHAATSSTGSRPGGLALRATGPPSTYVGGHGHASDELRRPGGDGRRVLGLARATEAGVGAGRPSRDSGRQRRPLDCRLPRHPAPGAVAVPLDTGLLAAQVRTIAGRLAARACCSAPTVSTKSASTAARALPADARGRPPHDATRAANRPTPRSSAARTATTRPPSSTRRARRPTRRASSSRTATSKPSAPAALERRLGQ